MKELHANQMALEKAKYAHDLERFGHELVDKMKQREHEQYLALVHALDEIRKGIIMSKEELRKNSAYEGIVGTLTAAYEVAGGKLTKHTLDDLFEAAFIKHIERTTGVDLDEDR